LFADQIKSESADPSTTTTPKPISSDPVASSASAPPAQNFPPHDKVALPALSPTMTTGTIVV